MNFMDRLGADDRAALLAVAQHVSARPGQVVLREGEVARRALVVLTGHVKIVTRAGEQVVMIAVRGAGDIVGELSLLDGRPRMADVIAMGPVTAALLSTDALADYLAERRTAADMLLVSLSDRLRQANGMRVQLATASVLERVSSRLLVLAAEFGAVGPDGPEMELPLSQQELADWVGAKRPAVVRALADLRRRGVIAGSGRDYVIRDVAALQQIAGPADVD